MNQTTIQDLAMRVRHHQAGAFTMALGYIGDRLGLFQALRSAGPVTSRELARLTRLNERYVSDWLRAMVSADYIQCDPSGRYFMSREQASVLADESSPAFAGEAFRATAPALQDVPRMMAAFRLACAS